MKFAVMTFGCQMNVSDSERINTMLKSAGFEYEEDPVTADLVIMNTCSVKQKAEDKVWGHVGKLAEMKKKNPKARIGLTGCMVRESGIAKKYTAEELVSKDHLLPQSEDLDFVFRIEDLPSVPKFLSAIYEEELGQDYSDELESYFQVKPEYTSAFQVYVPVQTGCDKFCTYCIVPFTRKREISRPMQEIIEEVKDLVARGAKEVTLLGQTVNSYKHESSTKEYSENNFVELLYQLNKIPGLDRLRYTSPHPMDMKDELIRAHVELKTMCPHVHLPAQSGDDKVLKRMNRKYTREQFVEIVRKLKEAMPDICITTDVIVGFCGETEEEFMNTYKLFEEVGFDMSFTSRYSPRKGTYSARRVPDDVSAAEKASRWHRLNDLLKGISAEKNKTYEGRLEQILIEKKLGDGRFEGTTRSWKRVQFTAKKNLIPGMIVPVKIKHGIQWMLLGELLEK
ncbi:MAG: tRNA (N6-isopentenyl adenosine(37)-C2)-methylthiotransferase MiaB [Candidatus Gracilibacteria bacterium]